MARQRAGAGLGGAGRAILVAAVALSGCDFSVVDVLEHPTGAQLAPRFPEASGRTAGRRRAFGENGARRRVWIVAVDGLASVHWQRAMDDHPFASLKRMLENGRGRVSTQMPGGPGVCGPGARFETVPGWATALTGHTCVDHGAIHNDAARFRETSARFPSVLAVAKRQLGLVTAATGCPALIGPTRSGPDEPFAGILNEEGEGRGGAGFSNLDYHRDTGGHDEVAVWNTLEAIDGWDADVVLTHFDEVDHIGHIRGWEDAGWPVRLQRTDERIGEVLAFIAGEDERAGSPRRRRAFAAEDWLVLLTSDHGGHDAPLETGTCTVRGASLCGEHDDVAGVDDRVPFLLLRIGGGAAPLVPLVDPVSPLDLAPTVRAFLGAADGAGTGRVQGLQ